MLALLSFFLTSASSAMVCFKFVTSRCLSFSRLLSSASTTIFRSSLRRVHLPRRRSSPSLSKSRPPFLASSSFSFNSCAQPGNVFSKTSLPVSPRELFAWLRCASSRPARLRIAIWRRLTFASARTFQSPAFCRRSSRRPSLFAPTKKECRHVVQRRRRRSSFSSFSFSSSFSSSSSEISRFSSPRRFFIRQFLNSDVVIGFPGNAKVLRICSRGSPK